VILAKLKEYPKTRTLVIALLIISIPFLILTLVFCLNELKLMQTTGYGVLNFELAWTEEMINQIFTLWGPTGMQQQALLTYIDFIYIFCYGFFGAECILLVSRKLEGKLQEIGILMALTFFLAGIFDALENINLLIMIDNPTSFWMYNPLLASLFASFKIGFLGAGLGFLYIASMIVIGKKFSFPPVYLYIILSGGGLALIALLAIWNLFVCLLIGIIYFIILFLISWRVKITIKKGIQ
jgi:hypothetical protein